MKILVAYATAHGSTAEIAQFIGKVLSEREFDVTVKNVIEVESVDGYDAFVVGSPIHGGMWLTEMSRFLDRFLEALHDRPLYFFITCIRVLEAEGRRHALENYVPYEVEMGVQPRSIAVFAGRLDLRRANPAERWMLALRYQGEMPPEHFDADHRDWPAIDTWSKAIGAGLSVAAPWPAIEA